ncbi:hypothetical protein [Streptomyces bohaiensis]|uniref:YbaB/EbfC family DNA-binding protein n=1 Tax=Streptomyces bohaiensis TaxID=1431344 RepID=A0ABX1C6E9_9ACTN|nr:hypothetical protein [Streptomyces bohaiensis]NJQ13543.1 hypothetical protein [Streptomyces bohaiensis]
MEIRELAQREAQLTAQLSSLKLALSVVRESLQTKLEEAAEKDGTRQITVTLPDGNRVGTISLNEDTQKAIIANEKDWKDWVLKNHPSEIDSLFVREVKPAFQKLILGQIENSGKPEIHDPETGEISTIPGIEIQTVRRGTHSLRWKSDDSKTAARDSLTT